MKHTIITWVVMAIILVGGFALYHYEFESSVVAQQEIASRGWEYKGTVTMPQFDYNNLKSDLALEDFSIPTSLVITGATSDGNLIVNYDFYSIKNYPNLNRQKPSGQFGFGSSIVPPIYFAGLLLAVMLWLSHRDIIPKSHESNEIISNK